MNQQGGMSAVLWLARREIARMKFSYLATGALMLFVGIGAGSIVQAGALGPATDFDVRGVVLTDIVILLLTTLLASNYTFWGSYSDWSTSSERKLAFMRSLPIPVSTLVGSRMVSMLFALPITVPAFFVPIYLVNDFQMGVTSYIAFTLFWVGYALVWAGLNMYLELVGGSKFFFWISSLLAGAVIALILLISVGLGVRIVYEVERLVSNYGLLVVPVALMAGIVSFLLAGRFATRGLLGREIPV